MLWNASRFARAPRSGEENFDFLMAQNVLEARRRPSQKTKISKNTRVSVQDTLRLPVRRVAAKKILGF